MCKGNGLRRRRTGTLAAASLADPGAEPSADADVMRALPRGRSSGRTNDVAPALQGECGVAGPGGRPPRRPGSLLRLIPAVQALLDLLGRCFRRQRAVDHLGSDVPQRSEEHTYELQSLMPL